MFQWFFCQSIPSGSWCLDSGFRRDDRGEAIGRRKKEGGFRRPQRIFLIGNFEIFWYLGWFKAVFRQEFVDSSDDQIALSKSKFDSAKFQVHVGFHGHYHCGSCSFSAWASRYFNHRGTTWLSHFHVAFLFIGYLRMVYKSSFLTPLLPRV